MKKIITVLDYGLGNIRSAEQSIKKSLNIHNVDGIVRISNKTQDIKNSTHIVLPGQGAFNSCMNGLKKIPGMVDELSEGVLVKKKPFLGICVGMQLLATTGYENGEHKGLDWIKGNIKKLPNKEIKLPHMGWNEINIKIKQNKIFNENDKIDFYFVHSYYFECAKKENEVATTEYGLRFASVVSKENIYGVQFHPEKSSKQGLKIITNFINL